MPVLAIAERAYSSWSLRGHLLMDLSGLAHETRWAPLRTEAFEALRRDFAPALTVPALDIASAGTDHPPIRAWDSLAIAETLHELAPDAGLWPADPAARAAARSVAAEVHSGFATLRRVCPMNLGRRYAGFAPPAEAAADLARDVARIETLHAWTRARWGEGGPWLFGARFTAADAFLAPIAARCVTYGLGGAEARALAVAHYAHPPFRRWRAMGEAEKRRVARYEMDLPEAPRFGPAPRPARALAAGEAEPVNAECPYSGRPVTSDSLAEIDGRAIGFCNRFCRDKSVADADAWPQLAPLLR